MVEMLKGVELDS